MTFPRLIVLSCVLIGFYSCIVHSPKYSTVEKVLTLKQGMNKEEVSTVLGNPPYNFISLSDSGDYKLLYKYRVTDRAVVPLFVSGTNGKPIKGKYINLVVTYDKEGKVKSMESCMECDETIIKEKKVDFNKVMTFLSVTLPAVLIFIGLQSAP